MTTDTSYQTKIYEKQGGDEMVVASGGLVSVQSGGSINEEPGGAILGRAVLNSYAADIGTAGSSFVVCPFAGTIIGLAAVNHGANAGTKTVLTAKIATVSVTAPAWEVAVTAAAGVGVSVVPTATNTVTAGQVIEIAYDGGSSNATPATFSLTIQRTS